MVKYTSVQDKKMIRNCQAFVKISFTGSGSFYLITDENLTVWGCCHIIGWKATNHSEQCDTEIIQSSEQHLEFDRKTSDLLLPPFSLTATL